MGRVIILKLSDFFLGTYKRRTLLSLFVLLFIFLSILMGISILWKPIIYLVRLILVLTVYMIIYKRLSHKTEHKLSRIGDLIDKKRHKEAIEKLDKVIAEDLPKAAGQERDKLYYKCNNFKAGCLFNIGFDNDDRDCMRQAIVLYEELFKLDDDRSEPNLMLNLGSTYYYLGLYEKDENLLKKAIIVFETELEKDEKRVEKLNLMVRIRLARCLEALADYLNREEYLKKSLEELNTAYDKIFKEKYEGDEASMDISRAAVMRKLNEISFKEDYKTKAIEDLNASITYYKKVYNKYFKKYYPKQYIRQRSDMASAYFEMYKITNEQEYLKEFKELSKEVKESCTKEGNAYDLMVIDNLLSQIE